MMQATQLASLMLMAGITLGITIASVGSRTEILAAVQKLECSAATIIEE